MNDILVNSLVHLPNLPKRFRPIPVQQDDLLNAILKKKLNESPEGMQ